MTLTKEQVACVAAYVAHSGIDVSEIADDFVDHLCCIIEIKLNEGFSFDEALKKAMQNLTSEEMKQTEISTLKLLNMEIYFPKHVAFCATIPFILFGLFWIVTPISEGLSNVLFVVSMASMFVLFGVGWVKNFPRWSLYAIGFCLMASFYFMFGTFAGSRDLLLFYAWIPFLVSLSIAFILNPSTKPLKQLGKKISNSPRLILFVLYGFSPPFFMICFDEFPKYESIFAFIIMSLLTYGLYVFLSSKRKKTRNNALLFSFLTSFGITLVALYFFFPLLRQG